MAGLKTADNPELCALVADGMADPASGTAGVIADWLTDHSLATPVRLHHFPDWLRLAWLRNRPADAEKGWHTTARWQVCDEIVAWLRRANEYVGGLDHWGTTRLGGQLCFVNEPYVSLDSLRRWMRPLADHLRALLVVTDQSAWNPGRTMRALLFPVASKPKSRRRT